VSRKTRQSVRREEAARWPILKGKGKKQKEKEMASAPWSDHGGAQGECEGRKRECLPSRDGWVRKEKGRETGGERVEEMTDVGGGAGPKAKVSLAGSKKKTTVKRGAGGRFKGLAIS